MSWEFKNGMKVVCVRDDWTRPFGPTKGHFYMIVHIETYPKGMVVNCGRAELEALECDVAFLGFTEFGSVGWDAACFRPVRTTSIECFREHLAPIRTTADA